MLVQVKKDFQEIVLSARQDEFYKRHMYSNFGDIGAAVKDLVDEFQKQTTSSRNINTIEDMQNFVENFSEFSAAQRNAGKHVTLMSELSRLVDTRTLMHVGLRSLIQPTRLAVCSRFAKDCSFSLGILVAAICFMIWWCVKCHVHKGFAHLERAAP